MSRDDAVSPRGLTRDTLYTADVFNDFLAGLRQEHVSFRLLRGDSTALKGNPHLNSGHYGLLVRRFGRFPARKQDTLVAMPMPFVPFSERDVTTQTMQWLEDHRLSGKFVFLETMRQGWVKGTR